MNKSPALLGMMVLTLTLAAIGLVCLDVLSPSGNDRRGEGFQRIIGGLSLGPSIELHRDNLGFDLR